MKLMSSPQARRSLFYLHGNLRYSSNALVTLYSRTNIFSRELRIFILPHQAKNPTMKCDRARGKDPEKYPLGMHTHQVRAGGNSIKLIFMDVSYHKPLLKLLKPDKTKETFPLHPTLAGSTQKITTFFYFIAVATGA